MKFRLFATAVSAVVMTTSAFAASSPHWSYKGEEGPAHWGALAKNFAACETGHEQSPVDLAHAVKAEPAAIAFHWNPKAKWTEVNNGHSIQDNTEDGGTIDLDGKTYKLVQFHFHSPSEHAIDGKKAPMEAHFVHVADDGTIAVLGAMIEPGGKNPLFKTIMDAAPEKVGAEKTIGEADAAKLLPATQHFYRYEGSLTTPPCSETVVWTVLKEPIKVSEESIKEFQKLYDANARPLQKLDRRYILEN
ncbi:carbonic anhydrase [Roseibium litorale]|uniref:carbonic anhydrase n=1 Tax=Roseibium litorale TaxID=2803841 RepID=A0ABR9CJL5_9HYPH|nr:carbonic anhydrase [Roseibium litorale]MBD8890516.1 carbonic anhydrase [Roseibium litorale]